MLESQNEHSWSYTVFMLKLCCYVHYYYELVYIASEQSHYKQLHWMQFPCALLAFSQQL